MTTARFCPQCGVQTIAEANFCAACGEPLPGAQKSTRRRSEPALSSPSWQTLTPGLLVLSLYLVTGLGLWFFVLQTQPFPSVASSTPGGPASTGGSQTLPQDHPPIALPEEVKGRIAEFAKKANAAPQDVKAWKTLAEAQFLAARVDASYRSAALESYRHILELEPNDADALRGMGNVYYDFEEFGKAIEYYQKYLAQNPDDPNVRTDMGTMYLYNNEVDRAIAEYQTVIAKEPGFFQAYFNLGIAYQEKGQKEKALESLNRAKTLTTDQNIQARIDQVIAQFNGGSAPTTTAAADATKSPFQQAVEKLFRGHEIMGPRINRIEWSAPSEARVFLQNFPMEGMPPEIRERFLNRIRTQVAEVKSSNGITTTAKIDLVDADSQKVMETINS
jgi:tetratricopeptide (TPR) repeat protein